jgi:hypothetical protein
VIYIKTDINSLNDIIQKIPKNLSTLEKARLAYLELGKVSFYNPVYKYLNDYEQYEYFNSSHTYNNPNVGICIQFTKQYLHILTSLGIKCYEKKSNLDSFTNTYHSEAVFYDDSGTLHHTSLANDLSRIQSHSKTNYFAIGTLSEEQLKEIDMKIGYINPKNDYIDKYLTQYSTLISKYDLSDAEKLTLLFRFLPKFFNLSKAGNDEQYKILNFLNKHVLKANNNSIFRSYNPESKTEFYFFKCFNPAKNGKPPYTTFLLFDENSRTYDQIDYQDLVKIKGTALYL